MSDAKATFEIIGQDSSAAAFLSALGNAKDFADKASALIKGAFAFEGVDIVADFVKSLGEMGDELIKGASTAGVAVQTFSDLAAGFQELGIDTETLSKTFKDLQVDIAKAAGGNQTVAQTFWDIGLSANALKDLKPEVQLEAIFEALSKIPDPTARTAAGVALLGRQYLDMAPAADEGAAGVQKMLDAGKGLGPETLKSLKEMNDVFTNIGISLKSFAADAVAFVAPAFKSLSDALSPDLETRIKQIQADLRSNYDPGAAGSLTAELKQLQALAEALKNGPNLQAAQGVQGSGKLEAAEAMWKEIDDYIGRLEQQRHDERMRVLQSEDDATRTSYEKRADFEQKINDLIGGQLFQLAPQGAAFQSLGDKIAYADKNLTGLGGHTISLADAFNRFNAAADKADFKQFFDQNKSSIDDSIKDAQENWKDATAAMIADSKEAAEANKKLFDQNAQYATQTGQAITNVFAQAFEATGGGLGALVANFAKAFQQIIAQAAAVDLARSLGITQAFSNQGGGSALGSIFGGIGNLFGGGSQAPFVPADIGLPFAFANGGSFTVGGSGGTDSQLVAFRASPNETVTVNTPGQAANTAPMNFTVQVNLQGAFVDSKVALAQAVQQGAQRGFAQMTQAIKRGAFS